MGPNGPANGPGNVISALSRNPGRLAGFDIAAALSKRPTPSDWRRGGEVEFERSDSVGGLGVLDSLPDEEKYDPGDVIFVEGVAGLPLLKLKSLRSLAENCALWP